jgi:hypothetical protein
MIRETRKPLEVADTIHMILHPAIPQYEKYPSAG